MLRAVTLSAAMAGVATANLDGYTNNANRACVWSNYEENSEWSSTTTRADPFACAQTCDSTDGCTGFEIAFTDTGGYCALWYNGSCSTDSEMVDVNNMDISTFVSKSLPAAAPAEVKETTTAPVAEQNAAEDDVVVEEDPAVTTTAATTTAAASSATTVEVSDGVYVLMYPEQACQWASYTEGEDWKMYDAESNDPVSCAAGCVATEGCTGFEVGANGGGVYAEGPYCALWLNGACSVPTANFDGVFDTSTGEYVDVDTYTLTKPIDAFKEFENKACGWAYYTEGDDWAFMSKDTNDADACAKLCLDSTESCTGFEVGSSEASGYGDLTQGYCALWYDDNCAPCDMIVTSEASTYLVLDGANSHYSHTHFYYMALIGIFIMACLAACCCCRRAVIRRRLAMQRRIAARIAAGATRTPARAVVYAVRVEDEQEEPAKV
mmetsp:Transcript_39241/g.57721  ORF Transcript_39241/g.57721 Transcript_39241/m.57721 type:complete len:437 (+) Transcript_39241:113-1423(+)|eukprot:CAMPEP_0195517752 /NCGR_PEP_ID=MMETSP0794_2-20130614/11567_1 /TAXON_ID=515487 /ORGANISM="Stephanopyxis turris, Strain CCMP 815" /LENGTH=436 /DNA_ID=CAMNT_0040646623 /DNA_START=114 /DNA_END=1424 /DNA_ORIENTATION=+